MQNADGFSNKIYAFLIAYYFPNYGLFRINIKSIFLAPTIFLVGCSQGVVSEAYKAEREGRIINNDIMIATYPSSFRPAVVPYLERDFEAGADLICDEIKLKRGRDICADADINWR